MQTRAPERTINHAQIATLRARVREHQLVDPDDYLLLDELLGLASDPAFALMRDAAAPWRTGGTSVAVNLV
jgi:hypothetical protein